MEPVGFVYVAIFRFYFGTAAISNLSTQPTHNNPISTTRPISNLYTQPSAIFHRRPVSKKSLNTKNPRAGTTRRQFPTPGNPLYSTLFQFFISPPVTSILPSPHALRLHYECQQFYIFPLWNCRRKNALRKQVHDCKITLKDRNLSILIPNPSSHSEAQYHTPELPSSAQKSCSQPHPVS